MDRQIYVCETVAIILHCTLTFLSKYLISLLDALLVQDGLICDDVGWCSRFNKVGDVVDDVDIGHGDNM